MEDRLLRAAEHLNIQLFEQFNKPYKQMALQFVSALTRGGNVHNYEESQVIPNVYEVLSNQAVQYNIQPEKLPYTLPYFNFDDIADDRGFMEDLKTAYGGFKRVKRPGLERYLKWLNNIQNKYQEKFNITKQEWYEQFPYLDYKLNKEGMRCDIDFDDLVEHEFVPVFGDSNSFGMALPIEECWTNKIDVNLPIYNSSICSASIMDAFILLKSMYETKKFDRAYVCIPHAERWSGVSQNGFIESLNSGEHHLLKQFETIGPGLDSNTRQLYRWLSVQALINYCLINDIKLHLWQRNTFGTITWCRDNNLVVPNWLYSYKEMLPGLKIANDMDDMNDWPKYTGRDMVHFGTDWHDEIAKYMLTNEPI